MGGSSGSQVAVVLVLASGGRSPRDLFLTALGIALIVGPALGLVWTVHGIALGATVTSFVGLVTVLCLVVIWYDW